MLTVKAGFVGVWRLANDLGDQQPQPGWHLWPKMPVVPSPLGFMTPLPASCSAKERGVREVVAPRTKKDGGVFCEVGTAQTGQSAGSSQAEKGRISLKSKSQGEQRYS